jgi:hypothetical protein
MGVHDQHGPVRARGDVGDDAVRKPGTEPAVAVGSDDDQAGLVLVGRLHDRLPGGRPLDRERRRPEARRLGQRRAVLGSLLGGLSYVVGTGCVELGARLRHEADAERPPHREDDRVTPGGQLVAGLGDRVTSEVRAVVGDEHRSGAVGGHAGRTPMGPSGQRPGEPPAAVDAGDGSRSRRREGRPDPASAESSEQRRGVPGRLLAAHPPLQHGGGRPQPGEEVEQDASEGTADAQAEADPQRGVHRGGRQPGDRRGEVQQDRHDEERRHRAQ